MDIGSRIYVAGARTFTGAAIQRALERRGLGCLDDEGVDFIDVNAVDDFFRDAQPEYVFCAAGPIGGIQANVDAPADLMTDNLLASAHVIVSAVRHGVQKLLYIASACVYPRECPQPMKEEYLLTGPPEPTNRAYSIAKIAGIELCAAYRRQYGADFIAGIPANPFGIGEDFDPATSHVIPAMIRRMHEAKQSGAPEVVFWGTGRPRREFLFADDLGDACAFVMDRYSGAEPINLAGGTDIAIADLARMVKQVTGFQGEIRFDAAKPDGMPVKTLDASKIQALGWRPATPFIEALEITYRDYLEQTAAPPVPDAP